MDDDIEDETVDMQMMEAYWHDDEDEFKRMNSEGLVFKTI